TLIPFYASLPRPAARCPPHPAPTLRSSDLTSGPSTRATAIRGRSAKAATAIANARGELRAVATMVSVTLWSAGRLSRWDRTVVKIGRATSELQSRFDLVCRLLLEKKNESLR